MAKRKPSPASVRKAAAVKEYRDTLGKAPPKAWTAAKIEASVKHAKPLMERADRTLSQIRQPVKTVPVVQAPAPAPVAAPVRVPAPSVPSPAPAAAVRAAPGILTRVATSRAMQVAGRVASGVARGSAVGMGVQLAGSVALGAYRDGVRGAGRGAVDALTFGFGTAAYDRKFGERPVDINREISEGVTNHTVSVASRTAATMYGARLLGANPGLAVAIGAASVGAEIVQAAALRKFLSFPPETDKDRADTRKGHRKLEARETGTRYSERKMEEADDHRGSAAIGTGIKYAGYGTAAFSVPSVAGMAAGVAMAGTGAFIERKYENKATRAKRQGMAVDYFARKSRGDNRSGVPFAVGQNASIAFDNANRQFRAQEQQRSGEFYDRTRRDPRSGKTIHEKVRNPHAR